MAVKAKEIDRSKLREYNIYAGLGGSFGGMQYMYTSLFESQEEADNEAWYAAKEEYESYAGTYEGVNTFEDAMDEALGENPEYTEEEMEDIATEIYNGYIDDWAEYCAIPTDEDDSLDEEDLIRDYVIDDNDSGETCSE
jgi:hypothetical protein|nr:MAG TPA: hypothetical protein [Caudoviricetes sp.]